MSWFSFKKDKFLPIFTLVFLALMIFLITMSIVASRDVVFYDSRNQIDVSSNYKSKIPLLRYIFEPIIGLAMVTATEFTWIITFVMLYVILRIIYVLIRKKNLIKSKKYNILVQITKNYLVFTLKIFLIVTIAVIMFLGIGYAFSGFLFLNNNWQVAVQIGVSTITIVLLLKLGLILFRYYRPKNQSNEITPKKKMKKSSMKRYFKLTGNEIKLFLSIFLLFALVNVLLLTIHFPTQKIETDKAPNEYLFDFHVHTYMSDGFLSPEERVDWYIAQGIDGAAFTDHENQRGYERAKAYVDQHKLQFYVIRGQEYTANEIHLNIFGINDTIIPPEKGPATGVLIMNVSDMISYVKNHGGFVVVNHYYENASAPYTYEELRDWGVDGFEIVNNGIEYPLEIRAFCHHNALACIGGSDTHTNQEVNTLNKVNLTDPTNLTKIFETLKQNTHEVVYIDLYPEKISYPSILGLFDGFKIWLNYFLNLDILQILSWICWSVVGFLLLVFIYKRIKRADIKKLKGILQ